MRTRVYPDYQELCAAVAGEIKTQLQNKADSVLVFPTGNTPLGVFKKLVEAHHAGEVDFARAHIVVLDEYEGLAPHDPRSLIGWLQRALLTPINFPIGRTHDFTGGPEACEHRIKSLGGLDLVILGLGPNGHLGFNEPGSSFDSRTRIVDLAPESRASNAAYWGQDVPRQGQTLGLGTLAEARSIILMVSGHAKHGILQKTLHNPPSPAFPSTMLRRLNHATVFADQAAMADI